MSSIARAVVVAAALSLAACGATAAGPPEILVDRTPCSQCRMLVSEPAFAAAYQVEGREPRIFDDIGCMLAALRQEKASPIAVWVQDANGGGWLDADAAAFVASSHVHTPMNGGVLAYANAADAAQAAAEHRGEVVRSLTELKTWKGDVR